MCDRDCGVVGLGVIALTAGESGRGWFVALAGLARLPSAAVGPEACDAAPPMMATSRAPAIARRARCFVLSMLSEILVSGLPLDPSMRWPSVTCFRFEVESMFSLVKALGLVSYEI